MFASIAQAGGLFAGSKFTTAAVALPEIDSEKIWQLINDYGVPAVGALLILIVGYLVAIWAGRVVSKSCKKSKIDQTLGKFFGKLTRWLVLLIVVMFVLSTFGIETASFAVVLGAAGLAIGLAFQGTLSNFAAGVMLLVFRPFKVADVVQIGGETGKVNEIELFTTAIDTFDNRRIIIPNSSVFGSTIENITFHSTRRADVPVGVSYDADMDKTREVLKKAAESVEGSLEEPEYVVMLTGLGGSSVDWVVRVWCKTEDFWPVKERLTYAVKKHLDEADISIPFPQMDVHLDRTDSPEGT